MAFLTELVTWLYRGEKNGWRWISVRRHPTVPSNVLLPDQGECLLHRLQACGCSQPEAATLLQLGGAAVAEIWVFSVIKCFLVSNYKTLNKHQWSTSPNYRYGSSSTVWTDINKGAFIGNAWAEAKIQDLQFRAACQVLQSWKFGTLNNELLEKPIEHTAINELLEKSNWIHRLSFNYPHQQYSNQLGQSP